MNYDKKLGNPKDGIGSKKVGRRTVPVTALLQLSLAMLEGGLKYGEHNWSRTGALASVYYDAMDRHLMRYWAGEDYDHELFEKAGVKVHHLAKVMACCAILIDAETRGVLDDDRPPALESEVLFEEANQSVVHMLEAYPDPPPGETQRPRGKKPSKG